MDERDEIVIDPSEYGEGVEGVGELELDPDPTKEGDNALLQVAVERGEKGIGDE